MRENNILKEISDEKSELTDYQLEKYSRQIASFSQLKGIEKIDAEKMQEKLCKSAVCIIGIGGVGSHLAMTMAQIGIGKLMLVDFDKIELSNTSRQVLYDESDIGKLKIVVAHEKLQKYSPNMQIETRNVKVEKAADLHFLRQSCIDLLVLCADTPRGEIAYIVDEAASSLKIPWMLHGPFNHSQIVVGPLFLPENKTYAELYPHKTKLADGNLSTINANFSSAICDPFNAFSSQFASVEILKFLTGYKKTLLINRRYYVNTDTWEIKSVGYDE